MHFGLDPMHCKGDKPNAARRIETLDRLHQADIAFLNEVAVRKPVSEISTSDRHDQAQMREDQAARRLEILIIAKAHRVIVLFFRGQHGKLVHGLNIRIDRAQCTWI